MDCAVVGDSCHSCSVSLSISGSGGEQGVAAVAVQQQDQAVAGKTVVEGGLVQPDDGQAG